MTRDISPACRETSVRYVLSQDTVSPTEGKCSQGPFQRDPERPLTAFQGVPLLGVCVRSASSSRQSERIHLSAYDSGTVPGCEMALPPTSCACAGSRSRAVVLG